MSAEPIEVTVSFADGAKIIGYVFERDALWFQRKRADARWHLTRPHSLRSWCGLSLRGDDRTMRLHVTWPWLETGCWGCMDRRWAKGIC